MKKRLMSGESGGGLVAASLKWMAWHASWHWASHLSGAPDAAKSEMQHFHLHAAHASDHVPPALLHSYQDLCMDAALRSLHERLLKEDKPHARQAHKTEAERASKGVEQHAGAMRHSRKQTMRLNQSHQTFKPSTSYPNH